MHKIVFFNSNKAWGGGEKWHFEMAMALKSRGFNITLITNPNSELSVKVKSKNLTCIEFEVSNLSFINPLKRRKLKHILKKINPHAVFMNLPSDVKLCAPIANSLGIPHIIYRRGMPNPLKKSFINDRIYKNISNFIANSQEIKNSLIQNYPELENKVEIVFNGVPVTIKKPQIKSKPKSPIILGHLGRLVEQKGYPYLIEIAEILKSKNIDFKLLIGGKGPLELELKTLVSSKNLEEEVEFLGHVNASDFFQRIHLFTFTSLFEGSANALIESLAHEVPAIAFKTSSMPEVVEDNVEGFLVEAFDTNEYASKIIDLINSPSLYEKFKENAHKKVNKDFLYENKINQVVEMIK